MFMRDKDLNQFQPNKTNNNTEHFKKQNEAINEAIPNREAQTKHLFSTYTDNEKMWLVTIRDEELSKYTGFMLRLKQTWYEQYPEKNHRKTKPES